MFGVAFLTGTQSAALLAPPEVHERRLGGLSTTIEGYALAAAEPELEPGAGRSVEL